MVIRNENKSFCQCPCPTAGPFPAGRSLRGAVVEKAQDHAPSFCGPAIITCILDFVFTVEMMLNVYVYCVNSMKGEKNDGGR